MPGRWSPQALVDAIKAAAIAARSVEVEEEIELVWTGPASLASTFRRTDRAWIETIEGATESVWLASFTVGTIERIEKALAGALAKGVVVNLLFETAADSDGYLASNGFERFSPSDPGGGSDLPMAIGAARPRRTGECRHHARQVCCGRSRQSCSSQAPISPARHLKETSRLALSCAAVGYRAGSPRVSMILSDHGVVERIALVML